MNVVITVVSWTLIIPWAWIYGGWSTFEEVYWQFDMMAQHIVPLILSTINLYLLSDVTVRYTDMWVIPVVSISYLTINYILTKVTGTPAYEFLTWDNWITVIFIFATFGSGSVVYLIDATLTLWITGRWEFQ